MQFDLDERVTVFEAHAGTGKPKPGGQRLTGTVEDIDPFAGEGTKVSVDVPGFEAFMTFDAETGQAWGGNYGWRLLPEDAGGEAATAAGGEQG
jgi:hypothetical protein